MAQNSRPAGNRPAARRRAPARRRSRTPVRWLAPVLAVAAGAAVLGPQLTPVLVEATAASAPVVYSSPQPAPVRSSWPLAAPAAPAAATPQGGLVVPQPPRPGRISIVPNAAVGTPPTYVPRPDPCGGGGAPRRMVPGVVAGRGSATLDWLADDRRDVLGYRVQAVSQQLVGGAQPAPVVQSVAQPAGCVPVRVTVTGLTSGVPYVFWLEEQVTSASTGTVRLMQVGTSTPVVIG